MRNASLAALERLARTRQTIEQIIDVRFDLRTVLFGVRELARAHEHLQQAEALASEIGDGRRLAWVSAYLAHHLRATVDHQRAVETGEIAIATARALGDVRLQVTATEVVAMSLHEMGQLPRAIELLIGNVEALAAAPGRERLGQNYVPVVGALNIMSLCLSWQGHFDEGIERVAAAMQIAESSNHPFSIGSASQSMGLLHAVRGDGPRAVALIERNVAIMAAAGRQPNPACKAFLGHAKTLANQPAEAVTLLEQSLADAAAAHALPCTSLWAGWLAGAYLEAGRVADAERTAERAVQMGRDHHERGFEGMNLRELGDALAAGEGPDMSRAEECYQQALVIAEDLGMRPLQAHTHLSLGKLYRRAGRDDEARAKLNVAIDLYMSMGMTHWLPEAEAELAALSD